MKKNLEIKTYELTLNAIVRGIVDQLEEIKEKGT